MTGFVRPSAARALRVLGHLIAVIALAVLFVVAAAFGLLLHIDLPVSHRVAARALSQALSRLFYGTFKIGQVDELDSDLDEFTAKQIEVRDEYGHRVLQLSSLHVDASLPSMAKKLLLGTGKIDLVVRRVRVEHADCELVTDPNTGLPTIARAFTPIAPKKAAAAKPSKPSAKYVRVWLPAIEIGHVYARGRFGGLPTLETNLARVRGSLLATPKGVALDVQRFGAVVRGLSGTDILGTSTLHVRAPGAIWSSFDGYFGSVEVGAFVHVNGKKLSATLDLPRLEPAQVRALWPEWPLKTTAALHAEASGTLPVLQTTARFETGDARVSVTGPVTLSSPPTARLAVRAEHVDLRSLWPKAPKTDLSADTALSIWSRDHQLAINVSGSTRPTEIAGQPLPAVDVDGTIDRKGFVGHATPHERGLPLKLAFSIRPDGSVDLDAQTQNFSLQRAPRIAKYTAARGRTTMHVKAHIEHNHLDASVTAYVHHFSLGDMRLGEARLSGHASGPLDHPERLGIDASLRGSDMAAGLFSFRRVRAEAQGPISEPHVRASLKDQFGPNIHLSGYFATTSGPRARDLKVVVRRAGARLRGRVARLDLSHGNVDIDDLKLSGAGGSLTGSLKIRKTSVEAHARGGGLDLGKVAHVLGLPRGLVDGRLSLRADLVSSNNASHGQVHLRVGHGSIMNVGGIAMNLTANLDQSKLTGQTSLIVKDLGSLGATWDTTLAGPVQKVSAWRDMIGHAQIGLKDLHLDGLEHVLPSSLGVKQVKGRASGQFRMDRKVSAALPSVFGIASTQGLDLLMKAKSGSQPLHIQGIDLQVGGAISGETGDATGTTRLVYEGGELVAASGAMRVDLSRALKSPRSIPSQLATTPLDAVLTFPERRLSSLPPEFSPRGLAGAVGGTVSLKGTLEDPTWSAALHAAGLRQTGSRYAEPVDVQAQAQYVKSSGQFAVNAQAASNGQRLATLVCKGEADWQALTGVKKGSGPTPWTGGAMLSLEGFPLQVAAPLAENRVGGQLYGTVALESRGGAPSIAADVDVRGTSVDRLPIGNGKLTLHSDGKELDAALAFQHDHGSLTAKLRSALGWKGIFPRLSDHSDVVMSVNAKRYDAVLLSPLLSDILNDISGKIDAKLSAVFSKHKDKKGAESWTARINGDASLEHGQMQIAPLGLVLQNVSFHARAEGQGNTTVIRVPDVVAEARSEKKNLTAATTLYLDGVRFDHGTAVVRAESVPVLVEGVTLATATGTADLELKHEPDRMRVTVSVPKLNAELPRASSRSLISLSENPEIHIEQPLAEPVPPRTGPILPWHVVFDLGDVRVTQSGVNVPVSGHPVIDLGKKVIVSGDVVLNPGGHVPALNHVFLIDSGRISFDKEDASNPDVDVTASWRSPDGIMVYVEVKGPYKTAKLRLYSDPPMAQTEILSLLLGGPTPQGGTATASAGAASGSAQKAQAVNIGTQALGLNDLFSGTPLSSFQVSASSSQNQYGGKNQNPAYTAAVRISDKVWLEGTYEQGGATTSGTGASANNTADAFTGAVDWRFNQHWSLRTEAGNASTSVDLLWHYRY